MKNRDIKFFFVVTTFVLFCFSALLSLPLAAYTADRYWIGDSGWWNDDANWDPDGQPQSGDSVHLFQDDSTDRIVSYYAEPGADEVLDCLEINAIGSGTIALQIGPSGGDALSLSIDLIVVGNVGGTGTVTQMIGTVRGYVLVGGWDRYNPGDGIYNLFGGTIEGDVQLTDGTFNQTKGTLLGGVELKYGAGRPLYNLSGGSIMNEIGETNIWDGTFNHSGGMHAVWGLIVGGGGGWGTYNLTEGRIEARTIIVGRGYPGNGIFNQSGGTVEVSDYLGIGEGAPWTAIYNLSDGTLEVNREIVGVSGRYWADFNQTGGIHRVLGHLQIGYGEGGYYDLSNGTLEADTVTLAGGPGEYAGGNFYQTGGIHIVSKELKVTTGSASWGYGDGYYYLSDGILRANTEIVGASEIIFPNPWPGIFDQTGGENIVDDTLIIGSKEEEIPGIYNLDGGTLTAGDIENNETFNYGGGNLNAPLTNNGITTLTGEGIRTKSDTVTNYATFNIMETTARFDGVYTNYDTFISDSSVIFFADFFMEDGTMEGDEEDLWYVSGV